MATHPLNLALRFCLELGALGALGSYGWNLTAGPPRIAAAVGLPVFAALAWGVFAVPGDPSRSGGAPIPVPGLLRLALELAFFGLATWALASIGAIRLSLALGGLTILHYALSPDRIAWLLRSG